MYCPVYCSSDSKNNADGRLHFFSFPNAENGPEKKKHFQSDAFMPSSSPEFLSSIQSSGKRKVFLKSDAIPTKNKVVSSVTEQSRVVKNGSSGKLARIKVGRNHVQSDVEINYKKLLSNYLLN